MKKFILVGLLLLLTLNILAQDDSCNALVVKALNAVGNDCSQLDRNTACYGYSQIKADFSETVADNYFTVPADRADLSLISSIQTAALDEVNDRWGIAVLSLLANLPETLPGQAVTFILLGDTQLENAVTSDSDSTPMQAFYLQTGIGSSSCKDAPQDGLLVQGPQGLKVQFTANGAAIEIGSTVFFTAQGHLMQMQVLDGSATILESGLTVPEGFGSSVALELDEKGHLVVSGEWSEPAAFEETDEANLCQLSGVPEQLLNYGINIECPEEASPTATAQPSGNTNTGSGNTGGSVKQTTSPTGGSVCGDFKPTSPLEGTSAGVNTFYWNPAPSADTYQLLFYNYLGEPAAAFMIDAPETNFTYNTGELPLGGQFSWQVQALKNGALICESAKTVSQTHGAPRPPVAQPTAVLAMPAANWFCSTGSFFGVNYTAPLTANSVTLRWWDAGTMIWKNAVYAVPPYTQTVYQAGMFNESGRVTANTGHTAYLGDTLTCP
ncbi:hypothetical protein MASR2M15_27040 [Anaerolineales bacterium]